jgi:hypothetical protein
MACPFCGQPLLDQAAVARLERKRVDFETEVRRTLTAEIEARQTAILARERAAAKARLTVLQQRLGDAKADFAARTAQLEKSVEAQVARKFGRREQALQPTIEHQQHSIEELNRRVERLSAPDRGEFDEAELQRRLSQAFPSDEVEKRGRGGDIIHTVYADQPRSRAGVIVYECKDTLRWESRYLTEVQTAGRTNKTPFLVIVTKAMPRRQSGLCVEKGVVLVNPAHAVHLAGIMRRLVLETYGAGVRLTGRDDKSTRLYEYICGEQFRQSFRSLTATGDELATLVISERRSHEITWAKRETLYEAVMHRAAEIDGRIRAIVDGGEAKPRGRGGNGHREVGPPLKVVATAARRRTRLSSA